jgi:2,4-diaminopentanoate dehydrogenase
MIAAPHSGDEAEMTNSAANGGNPKRYRVVQWATGNVGSHALRKAIEHPQLDVVGVWVHSAAKTGRDVGELAGVAPIGVKATNSIEDVIALKPDCVLYMPHVCNFDEICRLLESGINVVTTRMELQNPAFLDPVIVASLEAACRRGNSSVHAAGSNPGFLTEAVPIVLASIQRRLDYLNIEEFCDITSRDSPEMLFEMIGIGQKPGPSNPELLGFLQNSYAPSMQLVATALGMPMERFETTRHVGIARQDVEIEVGRIPAGTVAATRIKVTGFYKDRPLMTMTPTWFISDDVETSDGEVWQFRGPAVWHVLMMGDCPLDIWITFPIELEKYPLMSPGLTAHRPINAVPYVCDAPAGLLTSIDLPQIIARLA